jgi:hypothetical protein
MPPAKAGRRPSPSAFRRGGKGGGKGGKGGAEAAAAAAVAVEVVEDSEDEGEEEEESEEAQVCWSMAFTFLPLIWTIATEFAAEAAEAVGFRRTSPGRTNAPRARQTPIPFWHLSMSMIWASHRSCKAVRHALRTN